MLQVYLKPPRMHAVICIKPVSMRAGVLLEVMKCKNVFKLHVGCTIIWTNASQLLIIRKNFRTTTGPKRLPANDIGSARRRGQVVVVCVALFRRAR